MMTNIELAEKINGLLKGSKAKAKKFDDLVAVNFTFIDEDVDDIYVAVKDGVLDVAPYHYNDMQANVNASSENILKLFAAEITFDTALADGTVTVDGDLAKFKALEALVPAKKAAEKPAAKAEAKPAAKTEAKPAAKTEAKPEAKAADKPAAKTEAKPAANANKKNGKK